MLAQGFRNSEDEVAGEEHGRTGVQRAFCGERLIGYLRKSFFLESADVAGRKPQCRLVESIADIKRVVRKAIKSEARGHNHCGAYGDGVVHGKGIDFAVEEVGAGAACEAL